MIKRICSSKQLKIITFAVWLVLLVIFSYMISERQREKNLIKFYNNGNSCYDFLGLYDVAETYYGLAVSQNPTTEQLCDIRINQALSRVTPLKEDSINEDNVADAIATLEKAREDLCKDGCANMNDNNGHDKDAQTLKNEIDEYIEKLKSKYNVDQNGALGDSQDSPSDGEEDEETQKLRETFDEIQRQGLEERSKEIGNNESEKDYTEYYSGKNW